MRRYISPKEERAEKAQAHTEYVSKKYNSEIEQSIRGTKLYSKDVALKESESSRGEISIQVVDEDSVTALFKHGQGKTCVLNFASYKHPGGNFINGSKAQEESLCLESCLYNVLIQFPNFYEWNKSHLNRSLYLNRALYSPGVVFEHYGKKGEFDVLTCAAPNFRAAQSRVSEEDNSRELRNRIEFIMKILLQNNVDTAILGAFGCGVFEQDPQEVATIFKETIDKYSSGRKLNVVFAVPQGYRNNDNYLSFKEVFSN